MTGDVTALDRVGIVRTSGDFAGAVRSLAGDITNVLVGGHVTDSLFEGVRIGGVRALGDFTNSTVDAASLGRVLVGGRISEDASDGDVDVIQSFGGRFLVRDAFGAAVITDGRSQFFGGAEARVL